MIWSWGRISGFFKGHIPNTLLAASGQKTGILHGSVTGCSHAPPEPNATNEWVWTQASKRPDAIKRQGFLSPFRQRVSVFSSWTQFLLENNRNQPPLVRAQLPHLFWDSAMVGMCVVFPKVNSSLSICIRQPPPQLHQPSPPPSCTHAISPGLRVKRTCFAFTMLVWVGVWNGINSFFQSLSISKFGN